MYQLADFYSLFYLKFIRDNPASDRHQWINSHPPQRAWAGYAFEQVCLAHLEQVKQALGIAGIQTTVSSCPENGASPVVQRLSNRLHQLAGLDHQAFQRRLVV